MIEKSSLNCVVTRVRKPVEGLVTMQLHSRYFFLCLLCHPSFSVILVMPDTGNNQCYQIMGYCVRNNAIFFYISLVLGALI